MSLLSQEYCLTHGLEWQDSAGNYFASARLALQSDAIHATRRTGSDGRRPARRVSYSDDQASSSDDESTLSSTPPSAAGTDPRGANDAFEEFRKTFNEMGHSITDSNRELQSAMLSIQDVMTGRARGVPADRVEATDEAVSEPAPNPRAASPTNTSPSPPPRPTTSQSLSTPQTPSRLTRIQRLLNITQ